MKKIRNMMYALALVLCLIGIRQAQAQRGTGLVDNPGNPDTWIGGNGKIYTQTAKVGIGTPTPLRKLHVSGPDHHYIRVTALGGTQFSNAVAAIELERKLDNGSILNWDIVNQGGFKIRRNTFTLFHLQENEAQFGTQTNKTTLNIWSENIKNNGGTLDEGGLAIRNYVAGQNQILRLDANQLESDSEFHFNYISDEDIAMVYGGGNVRVNTDDSEAKFNVASEGYQLKLINPGSQGASWRIGAANSDWLAGAGKLVFSNTASSGDATMVMTPAGNVGIGLTTPSRTLHVNGTTRTNVLEITGGPDLAEPSLHVYGITRTKVLEITGGADLAEPFDIVSESTIQPGMVVAIDIAHAGQLKIAENAYDKTVAGIISGAGGIQPGMVMGQDGTIANGHHPVALTGRVYCRVDASYGAVRPGDLLTTSDTPGHAMKVTDHDQAQGAIIGKAMTSLEEGQGLVLVLVSLQ
jgi:hypothetical protein